MNTRMPPGELELVEKVARGGFATVWFARHVHTQHPLAIKFLRRDRLQHQLELLHAEARAISRLNHRHIATIYDIGTLPEQVHAEEHPHHIPASTPYIVMEWADQGTSLAHCAKWSSGHVVTVLEQTLGALAHIHAHGLLHLDIKPSNVLLTRHESLAHAEVRLVDMGLWPLHERHTTERHGTPGYMAPDDRLTRASDLYSVGMMALTLLGKSIPSHHDTKRLRDLLDSTDVSWHAWLERCLANDPRERFSSAAHAREALLTLVPAPPRLPLMEEKTSESAQEEMQALSTLVEVQAMPLPTTRPARVRGHESSEDTSSVTISTSAPSWPETRWNLPHPPRQVRRLARLGGTLFSQRALRFVGRIEERDRLWHMLREAEQQRRAGIVCLDGERGIGRRALATWFGRRTVELLGGRYVEFEPRADQGKLETYRDLLHALHRDSLTLPDSFVARRQALEHALTIYATGGKILFEPWQALAMCREVITQIARQDRLVLHLRGVQSASALHEILVSLRDEPLLVEHGVLVIATHVCDEILECIEDRSRMRLEALASHEIAALINQSLGLDPVIIDELARRSRGNPEFVRRTLLAWLQRDWLEPGARGLTLRSWTEPWLDPTTLTSQARMETTLVTCTAAERHSLAVLCLLEQCQSLSPETFTLALDKTLATLQLEPPVMVCEAIHREFEESTPSAHASAMRLSAEALQALEELLCEELLDHQLVKATLDQVLSVASSRQTMFRLWQAQMSIRLGEVQDALQVLRRSLITGLDPDAATQCLELVERLEHTHHDQRSVRHEIDLLRARALFSLGDHDADNVLEASGEPRGTEPLELRFAYHEMKLIALLGRGLFQEAEALEPILLRMLEESPRLELLARIHAALTRLHIHTKQYARATTHARQSSELCEQLDEPLIELSARNMYAIALQESDDHDQARQQLKRCYALAQTLGSARFQVIALNTLGDLEMRLGRWHEAQHWLRLGLDVGRQRYPLAAYLHGNLAWAALHEERADTALVHIDEALSRLADEPSIVRAFLLEIKHYALAMQNKPLAWDVCMTELETLLDHIEAAHEEGVEGARESARYWSEREDEPRASRARALEARLSKAF